MQKAESRTVDDFELSYFIVYFLLEFQKCILREYWKYRNLRRALFFDKERMGGVGGKDPSHTANPKGLSRSKAGNSSYSRGFRCGL